MSDVLLLCGDGAGGVVFCCASGKSLKSSSWTSCHENHGPDAESHDQYRRPSSHPTTTTLTVRPEIHCQLVVEQRRRAVSAGLYSLSLVAVIILSTSDIDAVLFQMCRISQVSK